MDLLKTVQLPEDILEKQTCTVCKKYLSYPPTKTYSTGQIKCGRCSKENDFGVVSSFDKLAATFMFPCVNRYEGCHSVLEYKNVSEHEKSCKGGIYKCPICSTGKYKHESVLSLINHIDKLHKKYMVNNLVVQINKNTISRQHYIYLNPQLNLIFSNFLHINGNLVSVNLSTVGQKPNRIQQQVKLFENYPEIVKSTSVWRPCSPWNLNLETFIISLDNDWEFLAVEFVFRSTLIVNWIEKPVLQLNCLENQKGTEKKESTASAPKIEVIKAAPIPNPNRSPLPRVVIPAKWTGIYPDARTRLAFEDILSPAQRLRRPPGQCWGGRARGGRGHRSKFLTHYAGT